MKGLVKFGPGIDGMEIREIEEPIPGKGQIKVKVRAAGICGSDMHIMHDKIKIEKVVMGHEYVGVVEEAGEGVNGFLKGDWVVSMTPYETCGECRYCKAGQIMFCPSRKTIGFHVNGAMAEYVIVPASTAFHVPDEIDDKIAMAACEPFSCATRCAAEKTLILPGDVVVISGPGTLGLSALQIAKVRGAYVIVHGLPQDSIRLELAKKLGADVVTDDEEDLKRKVFTRNPHGADIAFESSGAEASMNMCIDIVRKDGTVAQLGVYGKKITVNFDKILDNEIHLTNSFGAHRSSWAMSLKLLKDHKVSLSELTTKRLPLEEWRRGFEAAASREAFKILLIP